MKPGSAGDGCRAVGDGVAHLHFLGALDVGRHVAGLADFEPLAHVGLGIEAADFLDLHVLAGMEQLDLHPRLQLAVEDAHVGHHAFVSIEIGIEPERLQRRRAGRLRRRNPVHDRFENLVDADALLGAGQNGRVAGDGENVLQLPFRLRDVRVRQVDLVDDGDDGEVHLHRQVHVGDGLGLDALRGIHDEQRPFAGAQAARHLVGEIHVAGRIDQVQLVGLPVLRLVEHRHRDAP